MTECALASFVMWVSNAHCGISDMFMWHSNAHCGISDMFTLLHVLYEVEQITSQEDN